MLLISSLNQNLSLVIVSDSVLLHLNSNFLPDSFLKVLLFLISSFNQSYYFILFQFSPHYFDFLFFLLKFCSFQFITLMLIFLTHFNLFFYFDSQIFYALILLIIFFVVYMFSPVSSFDV